MALMIKKNKKKHRSGRGIIESNEKQGMRPWRMVSTSGAQSYLQGQSYIPLPYRRNGLHVTKLQTGTSAVFVRHGPSRRFP